ncbi:Protein eva-1-like protein C [Larimichthys crocea]|uniref:Uncharacterized protein n=1 Tax=Larimichthys crocea TaxID=215358 RepID=A0ACD3R5K6_LARCR|nr:Protein eva-1-like protein C [Larimichthys crocea]
MSWTRLDWSHSLFYLTLILWTRRMNGLADFSSKMKVMVMMMMQKEEDDDEEEEDKSGWFKTTCPESSRVTLLTPVTDSLCDSTVHVTPPSPSSPPSTGAARRGCAEQTLRSECTTTAAQLLLLCRSCCQSVRATEIASCLSTTCYLGRTPALALPNTSMSTTSVNQPPRVLNIYAAVYGRSLGQTDTCPSHLTKPPPFVPQTLLREADPNIFSSTLSPAVDTEKGPPADLEEPSSKGSKRPDNSGAMMSNSLLTYAYIKEHPEMAALLFTSSVCIGLLLTLLAVSVRVTCRGGQFRDHRALDQHRKLQYEQSGWQNYGDIVKTSEEF